MRITSLETFRFDAHANVVIVRLTTDEGLIGLGETFYGAAAVEAEIHDQLAPLLVGADASDPLQLAQLPAPYVGYQGSGAETRARSAIDIAAWDLFGQLTGQPLVRLLTETPRTTIPIYNTCAGSSYVQGPTGQSVSNWGLDATPEDQRYEDLHAFLHRPGELATDLVEQGVGGMKIWPFDPYAERHDGRSIAPEELAAAVGIVEDIRAAVGDRIEVMIELHALWDLPTATIIAGALADLGITWLEDPIRADQPDALAQLRERTDIPIAGGETVAGARAYRRLLDDGALDIPIVDPSWTGGLSEALRVADVASAGGHQLATHDCTGPISLAVCTHLSLSQPHTRVQETVRASYHGWYQDLVTGLPPISDGVIQVTDAPGLGVTLHPDLADRPSTSVRRSG
jgi:galactonate dehydratase